MSYQIAYNPSLGNVLVGIGSSITGVAEGIVVETYEGDLPDMTKVYWNTSLLKLEPLNNSGRYLTQTEFMRKFNPGERLQIRSMERDGDLVIIDAMALMAGTKEGVNLDDPDVSLTLQYLISKSVITPKRMEEILK